MDALVSMSFLLVVVLVGLAGLVGIYFAFLFNKLYRFKNAADANLNQIRVAMKKRLDMIEQLLGAVKSYVRYEWGVFETVASMRARIFKAGTQDLDEIDRDSRSITSSIVAVAEDYPDLKANETVNKLMDAIISVEDEIGRHRYTYNNIVQVFNTMVDSIPSNVVARSVDLDKLDYLRFEKAVEERPFIRGISEN